MNNLRFKDVSMDFLKKLVGFLARSTLGLFTILSLVVAIYGPEAFFKNLSDFFEELFNSRIILQISFLAILILLIFIAYYFVINISNIKKALINEHNKNNNTLERMISLLEKEKNIGISSIELRDSIKYDNDKYKAIFQNTSSELIISGHSLNKTINKDIKDDLRNEFMRAIIRLVKKNCPVKILVLKPKQQELIKKREQLAEFIKEVYDKLKSEGVSNDIILNCFLIKETEYLPYYIVKNEYIFHIGHYTFDEYTSNSQKYSSLVEANSGFGYGKYWYNDFESFFGNSAIFISEYRNLFKGNSNDE